MVQHKHFLQDRTALLLVSGNLFLALVAIVLVLLKLGASQGTTNYIVAYRASLGINAFKTGTLWDILSFIFFAVLVLVIGVFLGYRTYKVKRELALVILTLTLPLLVFTIVITNALLVLR
jgi:hypothetical protein